MMSKRIFALFMILDLSAQFKQIAAYFMGLSSLLQIFLLLTSFFCVEIALSIDTLSVNNSIRSSQVLISNGKHFKFGFFSPLNSRHYYVGVMYNLPVLTAVWVANRNSPLNDSAGTVEISENGNLVILDGQREVVWSSNLSAPVANSNATLLDTGNLVLQDVSSGRTLWESFRHASDSFLQGMKIVTDLRTDEKDMLTSWISPSDPALGSYTASLELLEVPEIVVRKGTDTCWRSGPWNGQIFNGVPGMTSSSYNDGFDIVSDNPSAAYLSFSILNPSSIITYFVLNSSGILQQNWWSGRKGDWEVVWSSRETECDAYGKCGPFGICNPQNKPMCSCLRGFEPKNIDEWNVANWTSGCKRRIPRQCEKNSSNGETGKQDGFFRLERVKLPDKFGRSPYDKEYCERECLNNCSCIAYAYDAGVGCMRWIGSLIDVQKFSIGNAELYIRLAHSELDEKSHWIVIIIATVTILGFLMIFVCTYFLLKFCKGKKKKRQLFQGRFGKSDPVFSKRSVLEANVDGVKLEDLPFYEFRVLLHATCNFDPLCKLGQGGFGPVYKGKLSNGQEIAVKRLARSSNQGMEEFKNEVEVISKLQHRNLVRLLGCCVASEEKILVYEYMLNGSLDAYLFDSHKQKFLDWNKRLLIVEGISRGLLYLHRDSRLKIIHRDLKASNVLLDEELNPKISDFGMARIFGDKEHQANTNRLVGTYGYMAPEYAIEGRFSEKSDVFSFGILLLEIVSGRRNTSFYNNKEAQSLVAYAWKLWSEGNLVNLIDPLMNNLQKEAEILRCAQVGLLCVQEAAQDRPSMSTVVCMLSSEIVELPHPKKPAFIVHPSCSQSETSGTSPGKFSMNDLTVTLVEGR